jgi:hypothetical protein
MMRVHTVLVRVVHVVLMKMVVLMLVGVLVGMPRWCPCHWHVVGDVVRHRHGLLRRTV